MKMLYELHVENMRDLVGNHKSFAFFESMAKNFDSSLWQLYLARKDSQVIAALFILQFNKIVEYFTPVIKRKFRSYQPLSLLIFESLKDSYDAGYTYYNFGGTWKSQENLYRFKRRWGAQDYQYPYLQKVFLEREFKSLQKINHCELLDRYTNFYVYNFNR